MSSPAQNSTLLELHIPDFEKAKEFYGALGFEVAWERAPEEKKGYLVMKRDNNILCFWSGNDSLYEQSYFKNFPKNTKRGYGVEIVIMVENINEFYESVKSYVNVVSDIKVQPWGLTDFRVEDPFGFYLRFTEPYHVIERGDTVK